MQTLSLIQIFRAVLQLLICFPFGAICFTMLANNLLQIYIRDCTFSSLESYQYYCATVSSLAGHKDATASPDKDFFIKFCENFT